MRGRGAWRWGVALGLCAALGGCVSAAEPPPSPAAATSPKVASAPPPAPSPSPSASPEPSPAVDVAVVPAVIDAAYLEAVMAVLDRLLQDAYVVLREQGPSEEFMMAMHAVYTRRLSAISARRHVRPPAPGR